MQKAVAELNASKERVLYIEGVSTLDIARWLIIAYYKPDVKLPESSYIFKFIKFYIEIFCIYDTFKAGKGMSNLRFLGGEIYLQVCNLFVIMLQYNFKYNGIHLNVEELRALLLISMHYYCAKFNCKLINFTISRMIDGYNKIKYKGDLVEIGINIKKMISGATDMLTKIDKYDIPPPPNGIKGIDHLPYAGHFIC